MSAFLGPIHFWLFNKITIQENLTQSILNAFFSGDDLLHKENLLKEKYGILEARPLEEIIDESNIHGWLQEKVSLVEGRYAQVVTDLVSSNKATLKELQKATFKNGASLPVKADNAQVLFQTLNNTLLDGMPCDRINQVISQDDEAVTWTHSRCIHHFYWDAISGDSKNYYVLRDAWIKGMVSQTDFEYEVSNGEYKITRKVK